MIPNAGYGYWDKRVSHAFEGVKMGMMNLPRPRTMFGLSMTRDTRNNTKNWFTGIQTSEHRGACLAKRPARSGLCLYQPILYKSALNNATKTYMKIEKYAQFCGGNLLGSRGAEPNGFIDQLSQ